MILVDTSIWVDFFHGAGEAPARLVPILEEGRVWSHPWVVGELATGSLKNRVSTLRDLQQLEMVPVVRFAEVLELIERRSLFGIGLGWVDANLLGSALVSGAQLFTADRRLGEGARLCGVPLL